VLGLAEHHKGESGKWLISESSTARDYWDSEDGR
jgi:hypothetical protein